MDQGLERAGHVCVCQCEKDERALAILRKRWPNVPKITDVKEANRLTLPARFDMLAFGFPCTDLSLAGGREGLAGDSSGLWFEGHRIAMEFRPLVAIIENVPGLFSSNYGRDFEIVLSGLCGVPIGIPDGGWRRAGCARGPIYNVAWRVLDSQFFGVAQQRRRVFIAACLATSGINPVEILFEREGVPRNYSASREAKENSAGAFGDSASLSRQRGGASE